MTPHDITHRHPDPLSVALPNRSRGDVQMLESGSRRLGNFVIEQDLHCTNLWFVGVGREGEDLSFVFFLKFFRVGILNGSTLEEISTREWEGKGGMSVGEDFFGGLPDWELWGWWVVFWKFETFCEKFVS